jgi:hypothetical protein
MVYAQHNSSRMTAGGGRYRSQLSVRDRSDGTSIRGWEGAAQTSGLQARAVSGTLGVSLTRSYEEEIP